MPSIPNGDLNPELYDTRSRGQRAYEADLLLQPIFADGSRRPPWMHLPWRTRDRWDAGYRPGPLSTLTGEEST